MSLLNADNNYGISNIRYGDLGKIKFDYNGDTITISEPEDVILVGVPVENASKWIYDRYKQLLSFSINA